MASLSSPIEESIYAYVGILEDFGYMTTVESVNHTELMSRASISALVESGEIDDKDEMYTEDLYAFIIIYFKKGSPRQHRFTLSDSEDVRKTISKPNADFFENEMYQCLRCRGIDD